jgi:hypothetical protein
VTCKKQAYVARNALLPAMYHGQTSGVKQLFRTECTGVLLKLASNWRIIGVRASAESRGVEAGQVLLLDSKMNHVSRFSLLSMTRSLTRSLR